MTTFKHQSEFADELTQAWLDGKRERVRTVIRSLKNKAQAAYIAAAVSWNLLNGHDFDASCAFVTFMHPNNQ